MKQEASELMRLVPEQADNSAVPTAITSAAELDHDTESARRGQDLVQDIKRELPNFSPSVLFDVGANIGKCAKQYASAFPGARVCCFEPVATTFLELEKNVAPFANCECFQFGFGDERATVSMLSNLAHSNRSRVLESDCSLEGEPFEAKIIQVKLETIDDFCSEHGIEHIDLLKIDTEGFDLRVLKGACRMLEQKRITFIVAEASMYAGNTQHVSFMDLCSYLDGFGFVLFGFYDQCREWKRDLPYLRRADLAFIKR